MGIFSTSSGVSCQRPGRRPPGGPKHRQGPAAVGVERVGGLGGVGVRWGGPTMHFRRGPIIFCYATVYKLAHVLQNALPTGLCHSSLSL
jgi:hypothetical protein